MKRYIMLIISVVLALSISACGNIDMPTNNDVSANTPSSSTKGASNQGDNDNGMSAISDSSNNNDSGGVSIGDISSPNNNANNSDKSEPIIGADSIETVSGWNAEDVTDDLEEPILGLVSEFTPDWRVGHENVAGNSVNATNNGSMIYGDYVVQDNWLYFSLYGGVLAKMPLTGGASEVVVLTESGDSISYINVIKDWIYFVGSGGVYKIRTDGQMKEKILSDVQYIYVYDNYLLYLKRTNLDASTVVRGIERMNLNDGTDKTIIPNLPDKHFDFFLRDGKLWMEADKHSSCYEYWVYSIDGEILYSEDLQYRPQFDGFASYERYDFTRGKAKGFCIFDGYAYYSESDEESERGILRSPSGGANNGLFVKNLVSGEIRKINNDTANRIMVWGDGYVYYTLNSAMVNMQPEIYRVRPDGTDWEKAAWMHPSY